MEFFQLHKKTAFFICLPNYIYSTKYLHTYSSYQQKNKNFGCWKIMKDVIFFEEILWPFNLFISVCVLGKEINKLRGNKT